MISTKTVQGVFCQSHEEISKAVPGSWRFYWDSGIPEAERKFPENVKGVYILMPVTYREAYTGNDLLEEMADQCVEVLWQVPRWKLSGTPDKPTLSPSLFWRGVNGAEDVWHGHLKAGILESC
jgi:hypothetical protein